MSNEPMIVIEDEQAARAATQAQMAQTARRFGLSTGPLLPQQNQPVAPPQPPIVRPAPPITTGGYYGTGDGATLPVPAPVMTGFQQIVAAAPEEYLLVTPYGDADQRFARATKMVGTSRSASWRIDGASADELLQVLSAFNVKTVDLRETD